MCYNSGIVRDNALGVPAYVKLVYSSRVRMFVIKKTYAQGIIDLFYFMDNANNNLI